MEEENTSAKYFQLIVDHLIQVGRASWADHDRIEQLKMDIGIVQLVFYCLAVWKARIDDEENKESLERCVFTPLKLIWPEGLTLLSHDLERMGASTETRPIELDSVMSELEGMILRSKQLVEGSCRNSMQHSASTSSSCMLQYCKYSIFEDFSLIVSLVEDIQGKLMILSSYRTGKIAPLIKQIDIWRAKLEFLRKNWLFVALCGEKYIPQFVIFIGHFANSVACFTFLYWANDDDEMDVVLFYMLRKLIPYAYDITLSYIGIFKSVDFLHLRSSDSFLLNEAIESIVDFFFEPLATVLKDDFPFLRDRLMFLFTFIVNPLPCENAEEKGGIIRSQIHAILHEDVYLLLSLDEINKDLDDNKFRLSGFMTRIDLVIAEIRQLYRGGSTASQITLEVEKMEYDYLASVHKELSSIEKHVEGADKEQLHLYKMDLRFLRAFLLWLATWDNNDEEIKANLALMVTSFQEIWGQKEGEGLIAHRLREIRTKGSVTDWHSLAVVLQGKIQQSKQETEAWCVNLVHLTFRFKPSTNYKILEFLASILANLNDLVISKASDIVPMFKKQIQTLEEKLKFLMNFLKLSVNCKDSEELERFKMFVQAFAKDAACFTFLYWVKDDTNVESGFKTNLILSHMLQKIKPTSPNVAGLYFGALMAICVQRSDSHMFSHTAFSFVELFLEDKQVTHLKDDDFQILQDNIIFLLTFLNDPPNQNAEDSVCSQIDVLFWEGLYGLTPFDVMERSKKLLLSEFMTKIEDINTNIRSIYGKFSDSSLYDFPNIISPHFLDFLLQNLKNLKDRMNSDRKYAPFAKYKIIKIEAELASLRPFFNPIFNLQSELKETWLHVVNVLHLTEYVIMSCISSWFIFDHPIWYHMAYLSNVIDEIKAVKAKLEMINLDNIMNNTRYLPGSVGRSSEINEIVVGFEDEKETIIGMLTRGPKSLDVVSIVGMGGLGKTTLAKKVYGSSLVTCHFDVFAFCSVSLDHNTRRLLHDIIRNIEGVDNIGRDMTSDDLAHRLRKLLSGQKYLVVLDDIWNESAWNEVKNAFPPNKNGSRVMLTTRSREVADKCSVNYIPHQLRFLTPVESWELLQKKAFRNGISPPYLYEIGEQIANNCKGLALAVVVIGGLLDRTEKRLRWWSEVSQKLTYFLSTEGCMDILELSYKHLPGKLKPCLLYLGAFPEDSMIRVKHVIMLWIAEGFIQESNTKSLEDVAKEYFHDLVDRSFVIVTTRSSTGGIKTFQVHDLIHELCRSKCRADNFFQVNHKNASSSSLEPSINNLYRVSIENISDITNASGSSLSNARTVHFFCEAGNGRVSDTLLRKLRLVQVLGSEPLGSVWERNDINHLTSLIHLRYMDAKVKVWKGTSLPSSISNLWNITSLKLRLDDFGSLDAIRLPETFWRMNSLRHVKVLNCILTFPDDKEDNLSSEERIMDKVVSFSKPVLSTGKDIKRLLQKLPVVRKLGCVLKESHVYNAEEESIEKLDFYRELESLVLFYRWVISKQRQYKINYPSTLKKLTLEHFLLDWTNISAITELQCLEVLKLCLVSFMEPTLETEDLVFRNLKFFGLSAIALEEWNASTESFPCLEKLEVQCRKLKGLPPCFGEVSTLKRIFIIYSPETENSARKIQEDLMDLGIQLQLSILSKN